MKILIVGQGLAGTILSFKLLQKGYEVIVTDDNTKQKSSLVAGGMVNPVVFRRLTKSWMIDDLYPELLDTTEKLETLLNTKLFFPKPIHKILGKDEDSFWKKKFVDNKLDEYIDNNPYYNSLSPLLKTPYGYAIVKKGGWFDIQTLISTYRKYLEKNLILKSTCINISEDLAFSSNKIIWQNNSYDKVILCQGSYATNKLFFDKIKYKNTKGEVLTIKSDDYTENKIISKNIFILPVHNHTYKTGSTYAWDWKDISPSESSKIEILDKLKKVSNFHYAIESHKAGIRPTTHDRRPVIGFSKDKPCIGIFNGLGSKGILLAPWVANQLIHKIENPDFDIHPEIDVNRYNNL